MVCGVAPRTDTKKACVLEKIGLHVQECDNHSRLSRQHDWMNLHDRFMSARIFALVMDEVVMGSLNVTRKVATASTRMCEPSCTNSVGVFSLDPRRSGLVSGGEKVTI